MAQGFTLEPHLLNEDRDKGKQKLVKPNSAVLMRAQVTETDSGCLFVKVVMLSAYSASFTE